MLRAPIRPLNPVVEWVARLRMSLHTKLLAGFLLVTLLLLVVVAVNLVVTYRVEQRALRVARLAEQVARAGRMEYAVTAQMHFRAMRLLTGDPANDRNLLAARQNFRTHLGYLEGAVGEDGRALTARLRQASLPFEGHGQKVDRLAQSGDLAEAMKVHLGEEHPASHVLEDLARNLIRLAEARWTASAREAERERRWGYAAAGVAGAGSLGLALFLGYVLTWSVLGAVGRLDEHLGRLARADFSQEVKLPNGDEFEGLAEKANLMMRELARAREEQVEQHRALAAKAQEVEELNRRLTGLVRQQAAGPSATRQGEGEAAPAAPPGAAAPGPAAPGAGAAPAAYIPGVYRCASCGATGRIAREARGVLRCPKCQGTQFTRVAGLPPAHQQGG